VPPAVCPLCEASCGIVVETDGDRVRSVRGDADDPLSRGYLCPKAAALIDLHDDPDRLRAPVVRAGGGHREATWDEALDRAAEGLRHARRHHGRDAVGVYYGNPTAHNLGLLTHGLPFARALGTRHVTSASSADQLPQMLAAFRMLGHQARIPVPDLDRTDFLLVLGANPVVSNGSLMTAPGMAGRLRAIRARGGRVVVVDPRRTETAAVADEHVAIRPGADALLLAAMLHVIAGDGAIRLGRLERRVRGLDALTALVADYSPERVAARAGVDASAIRCLARTFAAAPRAACYGRVGLCTQRHGTLAAWLAQVLNVVTGRLDESGGMMFPTPAVDAVAWMARLNMRGSYARWRGPRGLPEFGGHLPVAALADLIETGAVRALVTFAGNPVLSTPNGKRLDRALARLDHLVAVDPYLNETTRHADVVLPPVPPLARSHYGLAVYAFAVRNVARFAAPVVRPPAGTRQDWEIVSELAARTLASPGLRRLAARAARLARPERILDVLLRSGPHRTSLAALRRAPHGVDLGALEPGRLPARLETADGLLDLAPDDFVAEARVALAAEAEAEETGGLVLIGRRDLRSNNSWMHNAGRLTRGDDRCTLLVHPEDAVARGLVTGDRARLASGTGAVEVPVEVTASVRVGVVSLPHGWGRTSANDVTSEYHLDALSGNAAFNGLPVIVERLRPGERLDAR
jgi:anaerobic selenocysteine-containing dehydrogenase